MKNSINALTFVAGGAFGALIAVLCAVTKDLAVNEVRVRLQRRIKSSLEATLDALPEHLQEEWAEEWRAELAAVIAAPIAGMSFVREVRRAASELVGEPILVSRRLSNRSAAVGVPDRSIASLLEDSLAGSCIFRGWLREQPVVRVGLKLIGACAPGGLMALLGLLSPSLFVGVIDGGAVGFFLASYIGWRKANVGAPRRSDFLSRR